MVDNKNVHWIDCTLDSLEGLQDQFASRVGPDSGELQDSSAFVDPEKRSKGIQR